MIHLLFSSKESDRGISSFQALSVSLSGRVGTGNIAGVAAAIGFGGPGAVFWMWVVAFLGASTAYVESALGQIYKEVDEGQLRGGPAYYIEKALGQKVVCVDFRYHHDHRGRRAATDGTVKQHWQRCRTRIWRCGHAANRLRRHQLHEICHCRYCRRHSWHHHLWRCKANCARHAGRRADYGAWLHSSWHSLSSVCTSTNFQGSSF